MRYDENKCETIKIAGCDPAQHMSRFGKIQNGDRHINDSYRLSGALLAKDSRTIEDGPGVEEDERRGQG